MSATRTRASASRLLQTVRDRTLGVRSAGRRPTGIRTAVLAVPRLRTLLAAAAALVLLLAGWFWLRDSSLVAVRTVEVSGIDGAQGVRVRAALEEAARSMTTLHVRQDALDTAAAPFSIVERVEASTDFPHTMRIHVVTKVAVGAILVDGQRIAVTSDGTLLRDATAPAALPEIAVRSAPVGPRLSERDAVAAVTALGVAPPALRTRIEAVRTTGDRGLELQLAHGPLLVFGSAGRLDAKWAAAAAVLADPEAAGASTIDVTAPERPAAGGLPDGAPATGESDLPTLPEGDTGVDPTADPATDPTADAATGAAATTDPATTSSP